MTPDQYQRVKLVFQDAMAREPLRRAAFLATACGDDGELRAEVQSLIAAHERASSFIEMPGVQQPPACTTSPVEVAADASATQRRIGPYQLVRRLGAGGMGAVYLAMRADDEYRKHVAIKLIRDA